ncbi:hypothetical protein BABINDRAFT_9425 [Babjeviella inositovora NRRL Y-12698]|uniref:Uncharacterized protein n=1 Tax=Babjeviella inositovora NRRL Y-12698 TaxID=984486 RepID=A0A1E3QMH7_9ASCO|nr:uncharacterized protein BABINDRAFT_9425 [Babjeviella inositovora NRRL Y-12698]ODQ78197.1 hypothetical protein BABINDRAFT_9425 [Babjeviella inositovora NRRL Y-12698]
MPEFKKISRADLYNSESGSEHCNSEDKFVLPKIEFEFVETNVEESLTSQAVVEENLDVEEENGEFDFPLFAPSTAPKESKAEDGLEERGRAKVQKITLREHSVDVVINERPTSYYRAIYTESDKDSFANVAVSGEQIFTSSAVAYPDPCPWKILDLLAFNANVEKELKRRLNSKRISRPGQKKRAGIIQSKERKAQRVKFAKEVAKLELEKLQKKINRKRGGKKHKRTGGAPIAKSAVKPKGKASGKPKASDPAKPKYRTQA